MAIGRVPKAQVNRGCSWDVTVTTTRMEECALRLSEAEGLTWDGAVIYPGAEKESFAVTWP